MHEMNICDFEIKSSSYDVNTKVEGSLWLAWVLNRLVLMASHDSKWFVVSSCNSDVFTKFTYDKSTMYGFRTEVLYAKHAWVLRVKLSISMANYTTYLTGMTFEDRLQKFYCLALLGDHFGTIDGWSFPQR